MDTWHIFRLIKFIALALFAGGVVSAALAAAQAVRQRALTWATVGFFATWFSGYYMMKTTSLSLGAPFILLAMIGSLAALFATSAMAHDDAPSKPYAAIATSGLAFSVAVMIFREATPLILATCATVSIALGATFALTSVPTKGEPIPDPETRAWIRFKWIARLEGASLLILLIGIPLKKAAGVALDGGTGLLGWTHGVLFFIYLIGLLHTTRALEWAWWRSLLGFVFSLVPLGFVAFEWIIKRGEKKKEAAETPTE